MPPGPPAIEVSMGAKNDTLHMLRCTENSQLSDAMGLGCVETPGERRHKDVAVGGAH